jgi:hypothetical protein
MVLFVGLGWIQIRRGAHPLRYRWPSFLLKWIILWLFVFFCIAEFNKILCDEITASSVVIFDIIILKYIGTLETLQSGESCVNSLPFFVISACSAFVRQNLITAFRRRNNFTWKVYLLVRIELTVPLAILLKRTVNRNWTSMLGFQRRRIFVHKLFYSWWKLAFCAHWRIPIYAYGHSGVDLLLLKLVDEILVFHRLQLPKLEYFIILRNLCADAWSLSKDSFLGYYEFNTNYLKDDNSSNRVINKDSHQIC